jgi:hypothetical protein
MIHTVKLICSQQHHVTEGLYDHRRCDALHAFRLFAGAVAMLIDSGALRWECPVCGSSDLHYEDTPTHRNLHQALLSQPTGRPPAILLGTRKHL